MYPRFLVIAETGYCGAGPFTCILKFSIEVNPCDPATGSAVSDAGTKVDFLSDGRVLKNGNDIGNTLPDSILDSQTIIYRAGGQTTLTSNCYGIEITYLGPYSYTIRASTSLRGQVLGLCGTYDGDPNTDFTLIDGHTITSSTTEFVQSYQLPSSSSSCKGPHLPPSCSGDLSAQPASLCNAMNRDKFAVCNDPGVCSSPKKPVSPFQYIDDCIVDVCQCPEEQRERCACVAYIPYATACRQSCNLQIDLAAYPGCEVPVVELHPNSRTVWQGYPTSFYCVATAGWPQGPIQFAINGKDVDTMSNISVPCPTPTNCTLLIHRAIASTDSGTVSCCLDNVVGEDCKTAQLIVRLGSFSVSVSSRSVLVGSRVYPTVTKTPKDNPVESVIVELVTAVAKQTVTELLPSVPAQGKFKWDVRQLPNGAEFGISYRLRVWNRKTLFEGFSKPFTFIRDNIHVDVPVDRQGNILVPPIAFLGQKTRFAFDYSHRNIFMKYVNMSLLNADGTAVENIGMFSAPLGRRPKLQSWVPGISRDLPNDLYRLYAKDTGSTGAEGTSASFELLHGSLCIVVASHIIYGTKTDVSWRVEPNMAISSWLRFHVVEANDCESEVADVTDEIRSLGPPRAIWVLSTVIPNVQIGKQYRLRASTPAPTYLQACSQNTIAFNIGKISVSIATVSNVVYVGETYAITFRVPRNLALVFKVSVTIRCYGISKTWKLRAAVSKYARKVLWWVGHEEIRDPVTYGHICYASVSDVGRTGATGRSQNVTVAKVCVITDPDVRTGASMKIGVQFQPGLNLSNLLVQLVNSSNTSMVQFVYPSTDIAVGDNELTVQNARVPETSDRPATETFVLSVYNTRDHVAGYSQPVTFRGWQLLAKIFDYNFAEIGSNHPADSGSLLRFRFCVPEELTHLAGVDGYDFYEYYLASETGQTKITVQGGDTNEVLVNCSHVVKAAWTGTPFPTLPLGRHSVVIRDKSQQKETFLIEVQTEEFYIIPREVNILPVGKTINPENGNGNQVQVSRDGNGRLSDGTIAGIVIGAVSLVILVSIVIYFVYGKIKRRKGYTRLQHGRSYGGVHWKEDDENQKE
jgi:hypothetical protein